jgi:hypothetical protein
VKIVSSCIAIMMLTLSARAESLPERDLPERVHAQRWCDDNLGTTEVVLSDRTRVDCLTATHAVEVEFAPKWAEAVGQSLHYASLTGKRAGIVLVFRSSRDSRHLTRLLNVVRRYDLPVDIWTLGP